MPVLCLFLVLGAVVSWLIGGSRAGEESIKGGIMQFFLSQMWFLPVVSGELFGGFVMKISDHSVENLEMGWVEVVGGQGVAQVISLIVAPHDRCQNGFNMGLKLLVFSFVMVLLFAVIFS